MNATGKATFGLVIGVALLAATCPAEVIEFTDKDEWIAAVADYTTIDFTGFDEGTVITNQYSHLGITFTTGYDVVLHGWGSFPNDGAGIGGADTYTEIVFDTPQLWIAADYPGSVQFDLYSHGEFLNCSGFFTNGIGDFAGLVSSVPFESVIITDPVLPPHFIDDLYFGVPSPGALSLITMTILFPRRARA